MISPHHSRAISLQGKSDITLSISDITLCRWYHQVKYTGYINYISPFLGILCRNQIKYSGTMLELEKVEYFHQEYCSHISSHTFFPFCTCHNHFLSVYCLTHHTLKCRGCSLISTTLLIFVSPKSLVRAQPSPKLALMIIVKLRVLSHVLVNS